MALLHCRLATSTHPHPCKCPVWEPPESGGTLCDTCDHEAQWHLTPVESTPEKPQALERCKADFIAGQTCPCPVWVQSENVPTAKGCALCGHKKGWHRSKVVLAPPIALPDCPVTQSLNGSTDPSPHPDSPQSNFLRSNSHHLTSSATHAPDSLPIQVSSFEASADSAIGHAPELNPPRSLSNILSFDDGLERTISEPQIKQASSTCPGSLHNSPITIDPESIVLSAEQMRFILDDQDHTASLSWTQSSPVPQNSASSLTAFNPPQAASSLALSSPPFSLSSALPSRSASPARPPQPRRFSIHPVSTPASQSLRERLPTQSSGASIVSSDQSSLLPGQLHSWQAANSPRSDDAQFPASSFSTGTLPLYPSDQDYVPGGAFNRQRALSNLANRMRTEDPTLSTPLSRTDLSSQSRIYFEDLQNQPHAVHSIDKLAVGRPVPSNPLRAEVTSHVVVEQLSQGSGVAPHPSELGIGAFAPRRNNPAYGCRTNSSEPAGEPRPFQESTGTLDKIPSLPNASPSQMIISESRSQNFEEFVTKSKLLVFSVFPRPSAHVFSPGGVVSIKVQLRLSGETSLDQLLARWTMIKIKLLGTIARTGDRDDATMHQFLVLERLIHPVKPHEGQKRAQWKMDLQIPTHTNCSCGPGNLPLPSSSSAAIGHVNYTIVLKAKRRQSIIGSSTETVTADIRLRNPKTSASGFLTTQPSVTRSKPVWITLPSYEQAAIVGTILTYQTDFVGPERLRLVYRLEFDMSPDSQLPAHVIEDLSDHVSITLSELTGERLGAEDFRVSTGHKPRLHVSGYLEVFMPTSARDSQWILRASMQTVMISQPIEIYTWVRELNSLCSVKRFGLGLPLVPVPRS